MVQPCKYCEKDVKIIEKMGVYLCSICRRVTGYKSFEHKLDGVYVHIINGDYFASEATYETSRDEGNTCQSIILMSDSHFGGVKK